MEILHSVRPLLAVCVSLCVAPILASSRGPNTREAWTFIAALLKLGVILSMLPLVLDGFEPEFTIAQVLPGVSIALKVDAMGMLFALVSSSLWIVTSAYSIGYMRGLDEHSQTRYYCFFAIALSATIGVAFSANLFMMYLFYEMLSFATYPLVTHHQDAEARASGRKYLFYIVGSSIGLALPAMLIVYSLTGSLDFGQHAILSGSAAPAATIAILLVMFLFGFAKAGVMPMHSWLPAAMVAPTPVSALLHAVAVVKVGAFSICRVIIDVFGPDLLKSLDLGWIICSIASVTIITASLIALSQDGLKRRLAFSTIGQLSYIVLGVGMLSPKGMIGGLVHIVMHAFGKITLFMCAGAIFVATGKTLISQMEGIGRRMPITMLCFLVGSLSVIGIPPTGGFFSKWYMLQGAMQADMWPFMVVLLASSLLNAAYFFPIVYRAFFCTEEQAQFPRHVDEAPIWCLFPPCITAVCSIALFFFPCVFRRLAEMAINVT